MKSECAWFPIDRTLKAGYLLPLISGEFSYSHNFGLWMALCAKASYEDEKDGVRIFVAAGFNEDVRFIQKGDTQAYIAVYERGMSPFVVIVFRGTDNFSDLQTDLNVFRFGSSVHPGFRGALEIVWKEVVRNLKDIQQLYGKLPLHLTGHSLGGALALLAAKRFKDENLATAVSVVNIGCPRVGNRKLGKEIAESAAIHRIVHASDVVPRLPLLLLGYRHPGTEHWLLNEGGELTISPHPKIAKRLLWLKLVYDQSYEFKLYLGFSLIAAMLLTKVIYSGADIQLAVYQALFLAVGLWGVLLLLISHLVRYLPSMVRRWFRPHAFIDHKSELYVNELAARAGRKVSGITGQ